jgi:murein DD-endopeptidase MepM/ murein hydrolase activator NlpD
VNAWSGVDPRCGIGFTYEAFDGQTWTYCHQAVRDPSVQVGAHLQAGDSVGLVGHTGHASGPHLHLQLQPTTAWPQQEPWFQSFAGTAFTWSDAGDPGEETQAPTRALAFSSAPAPAPGGPVFELAPTEPDPPVVLFRKDG